MNTPDNEAAKTAAWRALFDGELFTTFPGLKISPEAEAKCFENIAALNSKATAELNASLDGLIATALRIRRERDDLRAVLRDLIAGADILAPLFTGAALAYIEEVKRVALAGLQEAGR